MPTAVANGLDNQDIGLWERFIQGGRKTFSRKLFSFSQFLARSLIEVPWWKYKHII